MAWRQPRCGSVRSNARTATDQQLGRVACKGPKVETVTFDPVAKLGVRGDADNVPIAHQTLCKGPATSGDGGDGGGVTGHAQAWWDPPPPRAPGVRSRALASAGAPNKAAHLAQGHEWLDVTARANRHQRDALG